MRIGNSMGKIQAHCSKSVNGELLELRSPGMHKNVDKLFPDVGKSGISFPHIIPITFPTGRKLFFPNTLHIKGIKEY